MSVLQNLPIVGGAVQAQKEARSERAEKSWLFNLDPAEFAATAKQPIEEFANVQSEILDQFQETNKRWLDRIQVEANLASELASKLAAARSIPDALTACQNAAVGLK